MEESGVSPLTQPPPAKDADEAALALTKRARKRSRYLSPPYTDTDVQEEEVAASDRQEEEDEETPPDVSAAEALFALRAAALWQGQGQGVDADADAAALRFLALYKNRRTAIGNHPDFHAAAGGGSHDGGSNEPPSPAAGGVGLTVLNFSTGSPKLRPHDGSPAPAPAKKKKNNPQAAPAVRQQDGPMLNAAAPEQAADGHIWASPSAGLAADATYGVANPATPEKKKKKNKKRMKSAGHEQRFGNPVALVLDFAAGAALPSKEDLISTFRGFGFVIESETAIAQDIRRARVAFATRAEAEAAYSCEGALGTFGPPSVALSLQDLPPINLSVPPPPPVPKLPLTDIRNNLVNMISSLNRSSSSAKATATAAANSPEQAMPAMGGDLVGEMQGLLAKVNKMLQGPSAAASHG